MVGGRRQWWSRVVAAAFGSAVLVGTVGIAAPPSSGAPDADDIAIEPFEERVPAVTSGERFRIYDPSTGMDEQWYINDHTFIQDDEGTWHLFGITHEEPAAPLDETYFAHATADSLEGPWMRQEPVMHADPEAGETHVWAPYVMEHDGTYYMYYAGGNDDHTAYQMQLATSEDLFTWTRHDANPLFVDGFDARDPMILRLEDQWVMYYTANSEPDGGNHIVAYRTSTDLVSWGPREVAFEHPVEGTFGGPTESPFVVERDGSYYMTVCCTTDYSDTRVYRSDDPLHFTVDQEVGQIREHASEIVRDGDDWWVSGAGWGQGGVWLRPLDFDGERVTTGYDVTTPGYRARVETSPHAALTSMEVPDGEDGWTPVLDDDYRATGPYLGVGNFGNTDVAGEPAEAVVDGTTLDLAGIPFGDEPVTADWSLDFSQEWLDSNLDLAVTAPTTAPVWEVGLTVDSAMDRVGDDTEPDRPQGDVTGFGLWTQATSDDASVAAAYLPGSAWSEDNTYYAPSGAVVWQPHWEPGGRDLPAGEYAAGTWRIGASLEAHDDELGADLVASFDDDEEPPVDPGEPVPPTPGRGFYLNDGWDIWADHEFSFGRPGDEVLVGDWDGDGSDTLAVRRGNAYFLSNSLYGGNADIELAFGRSGDTVLVGDWDGDGVDSFAVRRGNSYFLTNELVGGDAETELDYGRANDQVLVGDYDADGIDTFAVRRGNTYYVANSLSSGWADAEFTYGRGNDQVLVGDWDGDGSDTFASRRGNLYLVSNTFDGGWADREVRYGRSGDEVFVGDWNGDGEDTLGIRR
ncbi:family 43 glycosylhydrolase [Georgenia sp. Z1344]|uniref:family 43 glycosylhydrolase n=1 Tax=Georgenia sp. Z1344 TaxID=3416706 RepID=UPI003CF06A0E